MTTAFPAFIRAEFDASSGGFRDFEQAFQRSTKNVEQQFTATFDKVGQTINRALTKGIGAGGKIDLDTSALRQAVADAKLTENALEALLRTSSGLAVATGDTTAATRRYIQAIEAQRIEAQIATRTAEAELATQTRLQAALDATSAANSRLAQSYRETYAEAARAAQVEVGNNRLTGQLSGGRFGNSALNNGAGFQALAEAERATQQYERALQELRQQIDPLAFQQQRVNAQLELAAQAFRKGDLSAEQFAAANQRLNATLTQLGGGFRDTRQATIQTGQQLQDVAISMIGGQRAGTVLAQQLPQLAFAMSNFGGRVGAVATLLSGPWSLALVAGSFLLGNLVDGLLNADDAASRAEKSNIDFGNSLIAQRGAVTDFTAAIEQLDAATRSLINTQAILTDNLQAFANASASNVTSQIAELQKQRADLQSGKVSSLLPFSSAINRPIEAQTQALDKQLQELSQRQRQFQDSAARTSVALEERRIRESLDPKSGRLAELQRREARLREQRLSTVTNGGRVPLGDGSDVPFLSENDFRRQLSEIDRERKALEAREKRGGGRKGRAGPSAATLQRQADALQGSIDRAAESVSRLRGGFDEAPRDIDRATAAMIDLNQIIAESEKRLKNVKLTDEQRKQIEDTANSARQAQNQLIPDFLKRPIEQRIVDGEREIAIQRLVVQGREDEAEALAETFDIMRQLGVENEEDLATELAKRRITQERYDILRKQRETLRETAREQERLDRSGKSVTAQLRELDGLRGSLEQSIAQLPNDARGAITGFLDSVRAQFNDYFARQITDSLFGDAFQEIEDQITGRSKVREANETLAESSITAADAIRELAQAAASAARGAVNDNARSGIAAGFGRFRGSAAAAGASGLAEDILVTANTGSPDAFIRAFTKVGEVFWGKGSPIAKDIGTLGKTALQGSFIGQTAGGLLLGRGGSSTGSAIGGALGQVAGEAIGKTLGSLGKFAGPLGAIAGGLLGGVLGGALKKTKTGTATIGAGADGSLSIASFGGNSKSFQRTAGQGGDSVIATVERIAEALGAGVNAAGGSVSIGLRDGKFRVDTSGQGITKTKRGAIDFGEDSEAAIRFATADLIKDGVLTGLKATTQRILQSGKDLDAALQKALDFEGVFTRLKEYKDPVGAALDALDREFTRLQKIFKDAGASTEEYAQLEELYGIERNKAVKEAAERLTSSLKSLYDELTIGDSGRSLRDRLAAAQAEFDPLRARVLAGDTSAYDDFAEAARALLDIQRQFSGSQTPYFTLLDDITAITKARIEAEANVAAISSGRDSPFNSNGQATGASNDNAPVVAAIDNLGDRLLNGMAQIFAGYSNGGIREAGFRFAEFV